MSKKHSNSRRKFISDTAKFSALLPFTGIPLSCFGQSKPEVKSLDAGKNSLRILLLGGSSFLGPHQIAYALERGHKITTFTRGKTKPTVHRELYDQVEHLVGDRENDLEALKGRKWDAVIDNSGHRVQWTKDTAELLKDNVGLYLYTSSTGVYYPYLTTDLKETQEVALEVPEDLLVERLLERGKTSGRSDDIDESKIRNRFNEYNTKTAILKDFYQDKGNYYGVNGVGTVAEITVRLSEVFDTL